MSLPLYGFLRQIPFVFGKQTARSVFQSSYKVLSLAHQKSVGFRYFSVSSNGDDEKREDWNVHCGAPLGQPIGGPKVAHKIFERQFAQALGQGALGTPFASAENLLVEGFERTAELLRGSGGFGGFGGPHAGEDALSGGSAAGNSAFDDDEDADAYVLEDYGDAEDCGGGFDEQGPQMEGETGFTASFPPSPPVAEANQHREEMAVPTLPFVFDVYPNKINTPLNTHNTQPLRTDVRNAVTRALRRMVLETARIPLLLKEKFLRGSVAGMPMPVDLDQEHSAKGSTSLEDTRLAPGSSPDSSSADAGSAEGGNGNGATPAGPGLLLPATVPIIPIGERPLFPGYHLKIALADVNLAKHFEDIHRAYNYVGVFLARADSGLAEQSQDSALVEVKKEDLYAVGTLAQISSVKLERLFHEDATIDSYVIHLMGKTRIRLDSTEPLKNPFLQGAVSVLEDEPYDELAPAIVALKDGIHEIITKIISITHGPPDLFLRFLLPMKQAAARWADSTVASLAGHAETGSLQAILECLNIENRLHRVLDVLTKELSIVEAHKEVTDEMDRVNKDASRQHFLTQMLNQIKKELGMTDNSKDNIISKLVTKAEKLTMPPETEEVFREEMDKLKMLEPANMEFNMTRNYLDWLLAVPWGVTSAEHLSIAAARTVLDEDHYGLTDVKDRILEFIAVCKLREARNHGKILCFVGPPGVGKTSLGQSIARALNRAFFRFSVGGLGDVAEIKGHRRTYVGAMPGKIIQCLKHTATMNPVIMIDEIDKLAHAGIHGDPGSALLEVLDPKQNLNFQDHYLDLPVDLSQVLFLCTANSLETIPGPLQDRMEILHLSGYIIPEKLCIAQQYLIPQSLEDNGLAPANVEVTTPALEQLIVGYCREAGVRHLQQMIDRIHRKVALKLVEEGADDSPPPPTTMEGEGGGAEGSLSVVGAKKIVVDEGALEAYVGKPTYTSQHFFDSNPPGVVTGLAWTAAGGTALYMEVVSDPAHSAPGIKLTGNLGDVMKESADIAYTVAKRTLHAALPDEDFFPSHSLHLHCPEGATPKDGPSAGITMVTALLSLATQTPIPVNIAMTGEVTLSGKVLRIGGVREKTVGARLAGITTIILPQENAKDWAELPTEVKDGMTVHFVEVYADVAKLVFPNIAF
eukprot:GCRY01002127.1.p1 GENE.GCRY01002127.1~~GCRY01002127.1.p1  ORF type:complete len:1149 (-),score=385.41 GCRY01002127.1:143-3589(-)